jgi:hypothetical protein
MPSVIDNIDRVLILIQVFALFTFSQILAVLPIRTVGYKRLSPLPLNSQESARPSQDFLPLLSPFWSIAYCFYFVLS